MTCGLLKVVCIICLLLLPSMAIAEQGSSFVLEAATTGKSSLDNELTRRSVDILQNRLESLGEPYATLEQRGDRRIMVMLSKATDETSAMVQQALRQSRLEFRLVDDKARANKLPADAEILYETNLEGNGKLTKTPYIVKKRVLLTGDIIESASLAYDQYSSQPTVSITLNPDGTKAFAALTQQMIGRRLAIVIDSNVISAPVIRESITGGRLSISGRSTPGESQDIASALNSNFMPANLKIISKKDLPVLIKHPQDNSDKIVAAEATLNRLKSRFEAGVKDAERKEMLFQNNVISLKEVEQARTEKQLAYTNLREAEQNMKNLVSAARPRVVTDTSPPPVIASPARKQPETKVVQQTSDIDTRIPTGRSAGKYDVAVVIGNASYSSSGTPNVDFALHDAQSMRQYLIKAFGYDPANIIYLENATLTKLNEVFGTSDDYKGRLYKWVKPGQSRIFIYYVGHGAPDQESGEGYFVPVDANPQYIRTSGYKLSTFYENLSRIPAAQKTVVIDACFSGSSAAGQLLKGVSGLTARLKSEPKAATAADLLLTSAGTDQVASWYQDKGHSLFTYFFLKGVQGAADSNKDGKITMGEMKAWLNDQVPYMARRLTGNEQQPVMVGRDTETLVNISR